MAKKFITFTFQREGIHKFPFADKDPQFATGDEFDVSFLAAIHRHVFHFKVWIEVTHNNRDVEFIQAKRWAESLYNKGTLQLNNQSCEMMAENLFAHLNKKYPNREIWIEVSEDGENSAFIQF